MSSEIRINVNIKNVEEIEAAFAKIRAACEALGALNPPSFAQQLEEIIAQNRISPVISISLPRSACAGCQHRHGKFYGGVFFCCAMHPSGPNGPTCPDWEQQKAPAIS